MRFDNRFSDGQAKPRTFAASLAGCIKPVESFKNMIQMLFRYRWAGVLYADSYAIGVRFKGGHHALTLRSMPDCIGQQITQCTTDHQLIAKHMNRLSGILQQNLPLFCPSAEVIEKVSQL